MMRLEGTILSDVPFNSKWVMVIGCFNKMFYISMMVMIPLKSVNFLYKIFKINKLYSLNLLDNRRIVQ